MLGLLNFLYFWYDHWFFNKKNKRKFHMLDTNNISLTGCGARISTKNHTFCIFHSNDGRLHQPRILEIWICTKDCKTKGDEKIFSFKTISRLFIWLIKDVEKLLSMQIFFGQIRCKRNFWLFIDWSKSFKKDSQCTLFYWIWCNWNSWLINELEKRLSM